MKEYYEYMHDIMETTGIENHYLYMKQTAISYMKNGFYIPFLYTFLLYTTNRFYLSIIITIKLYSANHFYWFSKTYSYNNIPTRYNFIKQFVQFSDTGHLLNLLYLCDPSYLPLAHNIHFVITSGYWLGKMVGIKHQDFLLEKKIRELFIGTKMHGLM